MKNLQVYVIVALLIAVAILFWLWNGARVQSNQKDSVIAEKSDSIEYHRNKFNQAVAEKTAALVDRDNLMKYYPQLVKDINTKLDVKTKNILAAMEAIFTANGSGSVKIVPVGDGPFLMDGETLAIDTCKSKNGSLTIYDGYLKLNGTITGSSLDYNYGYSDTLLLSLNRKKHFFKGETISVSGVLSNHNAKITHTTGVMVQKIKPKRFTISVGVYYDPFIQHFGPAITAGIPLISF